MTDSEKLHQAARVIDGHCDSLRPIADGIARLAQRSFSDETILKFLGGNYLRIFEQVWGN